MRHLCFDMIQTFFTWIQFFRFSSLHLPYTRKICGYDNIFYLDQIIIYSIHFEFLIWRFKYFAGNIHHAKKNIGLTLLRLFAHLIRNFFFFYISQFWFNFWFKTNILKVFEKLFGRELKKIEYLFFFGNWRRQKKLYSGFFAHFRVFHMKNNFF